MSFFHVCPDPKHELVMKQGDVVGAVREFLATDYGTKSMILNERGLSYEDVFYLVLRDCNQRLTLEQQIDLFGLFTQFNDGIIFRRGRAMFEILWRLVSYSNLFVPLVCAALKPEAWQEIAHMLIQRDSIPDWHYNVLIKICHRFGSWALIEEQQCALTELFQTRNAEVDGFSVFARNSLDAKVGDIAEFDVHGQHLLESYTVIGNKFLKRAIFDTIVQNPQASDNEVAQMAISQETDEDCYGFWEYTGLSIDADSLVETVMAARKTLARKEEIFLAACLSV